MNDELRAKMETHAAEIHAIVTAEQALNHAIGVATRMGLSITLTVQDVRIGYDPAQVVKVSVRHTLDLH